ncbi:MAG: hypothetical protein JWN65_1779, partial [Solirubrobacterales bacterium]|nr:hypothetical protein [Solirubrobacterales bacterium]
MGAGRGGAGLRQQPRDDGVRHHAVHGRAAVAG